MNYEIRNVEEKDLMQIAIIGNLDWKKAYRGIIDDEFLDNLSDKDNYERLKKNYKDGPFIVAVDGDKVLGFCRYSESNRSNPDDKHHDCEICALYVNWEDRGKGIGAALVNFVKSYFKSIGKKKMIIWCLEKNYPSRKFYEKMGGSIYGSKSIEKGGKEYAEVGFSYEL